MSDDCYEQANKLPFSCRPAESPDCAEQPYFERRPWTEPGRLSLSSLERAVCASFPRDYYCHCCSPVSPRVT